MDKIKNLNQDEFNIIAAETGFNRNVLLKDYYITIILYLLKQTKGIYFKGGTALQKIFLNYSRLSEDIDFTLTRNLKETRQEIIRKLNESKLFGKIEPDKDVKGFVRLVIPYTGFSKEKGSIYIDLNKRAKLLRKPENNKIKHFYENIPKFSFNTLSKEEMIAEKVAAAIGRNKPRDHFDIYKIIKQKLPVNLNFVKEKCRQSNTEFSIIKMFNKAKKLNKRWDKELIPLLSEEVSFQEVIQTLAKHFNLKQEKEKLKNL